MHVTHSEKSPQVCPQVENHDTKFVSKYSTILVATIQEVKDRISQIEYIFCEQLYPDLQKTSMSFQKLYLEAKCAAENEWKEKQSELELQIKQLCLEREKAINECKAFKAEKSRLLTRVAELEDKLLRKEKEVDDGLVLNAKFLDLIDEKSTTLRDKEQLMKEREEKLKLFTNKSEQLEWKIDALNKELQEKNEEVTKGKELTKELQRQIESQELKIADTEQMMSNNDEEKKQLSMKLENVEASLNDLKIELKRRIAEVDEGKQLQEKLVQQVSLYGAELKKKNQQLSVHENEKQKLLSSVNELQNKAEELQECLRTRNAGTTDKGDPHNDLAWQIELKASELAAEKQKLRDIKVAYKMLKSQHCYLLKKYGLTNEDLSLQMKEEESDSLNEETDITSSEIKKRNPASNVMACEVNKVKQEMLESSDDGKSGRQNQILRSKSPSDINPPTTAHWTTSKNVRSLAGGKRPGSGWRETRSRQSPGGADPHDDFLDTPYENIRGNLNKTGKDTARGDVPAESVKGVDSDDDETQDMKAESGSKRQQLQAPNAGPKEFKYVEPVRKKAERENLNGIECKQCKKFYDAVLADPGANNEVDKQNFRCEHHDGVSRHRYRYVPPMTPEGFWNIGFDTET